MAIPSGFEPLTYALAYYYGFHHHFCLQSGLYLNLGFRFRFSPSSLYTFSVSRTWLGIGILQRSPNLTSFIYRISPIRLLLLFQLQERCSNPIELWDLKLVQGIRIELMLGPHLGHTGYKSVGTSIYTNLAYYLYRFFLQNCKEEISCDRIRTDT